MPDLPRDFEEAVKRLQQDIERIKARDQKKNFGNPGRRAELQLDIHDLGLFLAFLRFHQCFTTKAEVRHKQSQRYLDGGRYIESVEAAKRALNEIKGTILKPEFAHRQIHVESRYTELTEKFESYQSD